MGRWFKSPFATFKRSVKPTMLQEAAMQADWNASLFSSIQLSANMVRVLRSLLVVGSPTLTPSCRY